MIPQLEGRTARESFLSLCVSPLVQLGSALLLSDVVRDMGRVYPILDEVYCLYLFSFVLGDGLRFVETRGQLFEPQAAQAWLVEHPKDLRGVKRNNHYPRPHGRAFFCLA